MSGHRDFFEDLEAKTPREKALAAEYEVLTRAVVRLARLREQRGITQTALAQMLNVAQPTLSKLERGTDMRLTTLTKYISAMGGSLRLTAVFDDVECDLGVLKAGADSDLFDEVHGRPNDAIASHHEKLPYLHFDAEIGQRGAFLVSNMPYPSSDSAEDDYGLLRLAG